LNDAVATRIVLLRGVNLGSSRRVRMETLRELLGARGYGNVQTLAKPFKIKELASRIQSMLAP